VTVAIHVNGEPRDVEPGTTVAGLVGAAGVAPEARGVAVAVDGEVVPRGAWEHAVLGAGARVEIVTAVAGG
jgi:sulfur carrier protein